MSEFIVEPNPYPTYKIDGFNVRCDDWLIQHEEIVRCRDCINLEHWKFRDGSERLVCCMVDVFDVFEDGFCAWGERKENGC